LILLLFLNQIINFFNGRKAIVSIQSLKWNSLLSYCFLPLLLLMVWSTPGITAEKDRGIEKVATITHQNNGQVIEIKYGEEFRVELEELGSAGYQWHLEKVDQEYLELGSKETRVLAEGRVGAPLMAIWRFKTKKIGLTDLAMDHYRPWEGKDKASKHFSIRLLIK
jgi:predicted secreted protein